MPSSFSTNGASIRRRKRRRVEDFTLPWDDPSDFDDPPVVAAAASPSASYEESKPGTPAGWWEKLYVTGKQPIGRRSASAAVYRVMREEPARDDQDGDDVMAETDAGDAQHMSNGTNTACTTPPRWKPPDYDRIIKEYMVVSGGFSDDDWTTFPVSAFDMGGEEQPAEMGGVYKWLDLTAEGANSSSNTTASSGSTGSNGPEGRVGHMSAIYDKKLYVFGGLTYKHQLFHLEDDLCVWEARIDHLLPGSGAIDIENAINTNTSTTLVWKRLIPRIVNPATEEIGGDKPMAIGNDGDDRFEPLHSMPMNMEDGNNRRNLVSDSNPAMEYKLPRGEIAGGLWNPSNSNDESLPVSAFVFFGGLSVTHRRNPHTHANPPYVQMDEPLGDVWMYDLLSNEFHRLAPYPPEAWQCDPLTGRYPIARTAHAATVVNGELIIYGGMALNSYTPINWDGTSNWNTLSDVWAFDLKERVWSERAAIEPKLERAYHSMVSWGDGSIAAFGGFRTMTALGGEPITFVFNDLVVARPYNDTWQKAQWPDIFSARTISNRLEQVSAVNKDGDVFVFGGRFKTTSQVSGIWMLPVFGDSTVVFSPATVFNDDFEEELDALQLLVTVTMFMFLLFSALYTSSRRQQIHTIHPATGGTTLPIASGGRRRNGLGQEVIDSFPVRVFASPDGVSGKNDESGGDGVDDNDDEQEDTCPICLVEYHDEDEVRALPCNHIFHPTCIDDWLSTHASCPSCRQNFSNSDTYSSRPSNTAENPDYDPTWENLRRSVWGESPSFLSPFLLSGLANGVSFDNRLSGQGQDHDLGDNSDGQSLDRSTVPQNAAQAATSAENADIDDQESTLHHPNTYHSNIRVRRLQIGRARGYRTVSRGGGSTEMVELSSNSRSINPVV